MRAVLLCLLVLVSPLALAQSEATAEFSPQVEIVARDIGKSLRCVVCQNQSIEDSAAPLAADMRRLVRERVAAGESPDQVVNYMRDRYGNFVLLRPPFQIDTLLLWLGPVALSLLAAWGWLAFLRPARRRVLTPAPLSEAEAVELARRVSSEKVN